MKLYRLFLQCCILYLSFFTKLWGVNYELAAIRGPCQSTHIRASEDWNGQPLSAIVFSPRGHGSQRGQLLETCGRGQFDHNLNNRANFVHILLKH